MSGQRDWKRTNRGRYKHRIALSALTNALATLKELSSRITHPASNTTVAPFVWNVRLVPWPDARGAKQTRRSRKQARSGVAGGAWRRGGFPGQTIAPALQLGCLASFFGSGEAVGALAHHRHHGKRQHHQRDLPMPAMPGAGRISVRGRRAAAPLCHQRGCGQPI